MERRVLKAGTVIHLHGIPLELVSDTPAETSAGNWPLIDEGAKLFGSGRVSSSGHESCGSDVRHDPSAVWYGPHECPECGALIVRAEAVRGGAMFDVPAHLLRIYQRGAESGNQDHAYPTVWKPHVHKFDARTR